MTTMSTKKLVYTAVMMALVCIATSIIKIPTPFTSGYIHLGDSMIFLSVAILGWGYGALAAGIGSMLADILGGYAVWALPTLIIKSLMAIIMGIALNSTSRKRTFAFAGGIGVVWTAFTLILKNVLSSNVTESSTALLSQMEDISSMQDLVALSSKVQLQLVVAAVLTLIILAVISTVVVKRLGMGSLKLILGMMASGLIMIIGYYFAAYLLYGSYITAIFSIPANIVQFIMGFVLAMLVIVPLKKTPLFEEFRMNQ